MKLMLLTGPRDEDGRHEGGVKVKRRTRVEAVILHDSLDELHVRHEDDVRRCQPQAEHWAVLLSQLTQFFRWILWQERQVTNDRKAYWSRRQLSP